MYIGASSIWMIHPWSTGQVPFSSSLDLVYNLGGVKLRAHVWLSVYSSTGSFWAPLLLRPYALCLALRLSTPTGDRLANCDNIFPRTYLDPLCNGVLAASGDQWRSKDLSENRAVCIMSELQRTCKRRKEVIRSLAHPRAAACPEEQLKCVRTFLPCWLFLKIWMPESVHHQDP